MCNIIELEHFMNACSCAVKSVSECKKCSVYLEYLEQKQMEFKNESNNI